MKHLKIVDLHIWLSAITSAGSKKAPTQRCTILFYKTRNAPRFQHTLDSSRVNARTKSSHRSNHATEHLLLIFSDLYHVIWGFRSPSLESIAIAQSEPPSISTETEFVSHQHTNICFIEFTRTDKWQVRGIQEEYQVPDASQQSGFVLDTLQAQIDNSSIQMSRAGSRRYNLFIKPKVIHAGQQGGIPFKVGDCSMYRFIGLFKDLSQPTLGPWILFLCHSMLMIQVYFKFLDNVLRSVRPFTPNRGRRKKIPVTLTCKRWREV